MNLIGHPLETITRQIAKCGIKIRPGHGERYFQVGKASPPNH
jgi:hypothetical protein